MTVFRKPAYRYLPVHSNRQETVAESLETFYTKLADHQNQSDHVFDEFIEPLH